MNKFVRVMVSGVLGALPMGLYPLAAMPQSGSDAVSIESYDEPRLRPLSVEEADRAVQVLQRESASRQAGAAAAPGRVETVLVENLAREDKDEAPGSRRAHVVTYNYDTNETSSAVVAIWPRESVEHVDVSAGPPPYVSPRELERAKQMALRHPEVQARLRANAPGTSYQELLVTHLLAQGTNAQQPCAKQRCVLLFMGTAEAVFDMNVLVNLTTGEVRVY